METPMDSWNDDRLDELSRRMDDGFKELRGEMQDGFARIDQRFEQVNQRFERLYITMIAASFSLVASVILALVFG